MTAYHRPYAEDCRQKRGPGNALNRPASARSAARAPHQMSRRSHGGSVSPPFHPRQPARITEGSSAGVASRPMQQGRAVAGALTCHCDMSTAELNASR
jgi:hypothetical protein